MTVETVAKEFEEEKRKMDERGEQKEDECG